MESEKRKEQKRIYKKETKEFWKKHGICVKCGKQRAFEGRTMCPECLEKENERKRNRVKTPEERERNRKRDKERYYAHKEQGLCVNCSRKAASGHVYCTECRIRIRRSNAAWIERTGRKKWYAENGVCLYCGGERAEGNKLCETCLQAQRERMAYARQFSPSGKKWGGHAP